MISDPLKQAIQLIRSGNKIEARQILKRVLIEDPTNDTAWLWFIDTLPSDVERRIALEGLQKINPDSKVARIGLAEYHPKQQPKGERLRPEPSGEAAPALKSAKINKDQENNPKKISFPSKTLAEMELESLPVEESPRQPVIESEARDTSARKNDLSSSKKLSTPAHILISAGLALIFVIILAVFLAKFGWAEKYPILNIFAPASTLPCSCADADAYLVGVNGRIQRWKTSQALAIFAQASGKKALDLEFARNLLVEEQGEKPPACMKTAHELSLSLLEYNADFIEQLQNGDMTSAANYKKIVDDYQSQLADEFSVINKGYICQ